MQNCDPSKIKRDLSVLTDYAKASDTISDVAVLAATIAMDDMVTRFAYRIGFSRPAGTFGEIYDKNIGVIIEILLIICAEEGLWIYHAKLNKLLSRYSKKIVSRTLDGPIEAGFDLGYLRKFSPNQLKGNPSSQAVGDTRRSVIRPTPKALLCLYDMKVATNELARPPNAAEIRLKLGPTDYDRRKKVLAEAVANARADHDFIFKSIRGR